MQLNLRGLLGLAGRAPFATAADPSLLAGNHDPISERRSIARRCAVAGAASAPAAMAAPGPAAAVSGDRLSSVSAAPGPDAPQRHGGNADHGQGSGHDLAHDHDHDHGDGVCEGLLSEQAWLAAQGGMDQTLADNSNVLLGAALLPLDQTFRLHSNPGASKVIYIDFDGHTTSGTSWNTWNGGVMGSSFTSPAFDTNGDPTSFSSQELTLIQNAWQRVAADFAAFDVDVTTQAPPQDWLINSGNGDGNYGVRVVVTSFGPSSGSSGGIGYINSFTWNSDTPAFVYNTSLLGVSEAISHEVGHTLGLAHDGTFNGSTTVSYYAGHGSGAQGWAPIMGNGYTRNLTTWDSGVYYQSNNSGSGANYNRGADDLAIITGFNGFSYQADLEGDSLASAVVLPVSAGAVSQFGTIETARDQDWFRLDLPQDSQVDLRFDPYVYRGFIDSDDIWGGTVAMHTARVSDADGSTSYADHGSNLDLRIDLLDGLGSLLSSTGSNGQFAQFSASLGAGSYYFRLDGVGYGDPSLSSPSGYTDIASIGDYLISGTVTAVPVTPPTPEISLALSPSRVAEDGTANLVYTFSRSAVSADPLTVAFSVSGSATNGTDYRGLVAGSSQTITFAGGAATATLLIDPTADSSVEADETVSLTLVAGSGYSLATTSAVTGTISNDDVSAPALVFTSAVDSLTGTSQADRFVMTRLADALWSSTPDRITNLQAGIDTIDSPFARSTAIKPRLLGGVQTLDAAGIGAVLTGRAFAKNAAATFSFGSGSTQRTFLALNDGFSGFNASTDSVLEITGFSGSLSSLAIL